MATISISGTNKLAERIVTEAEADAKAVLSDAEASIRAIRAESEKSVSGKRAELGAKRDTAVKSVLSGYETRAALEGRKSVLAKKRAVIDRAFSGAYQALLSLDKGERGGICKRMLAAEAEGGERVVPAAADRAAVESAIAEMPEKHLSLSGENAPIDGGFLLVSEGYEKDCSFASLLSMVRGEQETSVAKLLFD